MAYFNTGKATIDENLQIVKADKSFYQFIAYYNPIFIEQSVCKDDFFGLKKTIEKVFATGERTVYTYRVLRADNTLHWVIADINKIELTQSQPVIELSIQAIDSLEEDLRQNMQTVQELGIYLDILDEIFFKYDVTLDEFCVFIGGDKQRVNMYEGSLSTWAEKIVAQNPFTDKFKEIFESLLDDLRTGTKHFSHEIMLPNLIHGDSKELYLFKGRSIIDNSGKMQVLGCIYTIAQGSHRKKIELGSDAARDEMTGLLTKQTIIDYVQNSIHNKIEGNSYLCILDVDNFKYVNDHFGHMFGDKVLVTVADIIKEAVDGIGVAGRIGGDEMMLFLENIADRATLRNILRTIRTNVEWAYKSAHEDMHLSCSIGVAGCPIDSTNYDDLFKIADKMLYRAKEGGKNRYIIYTPEYHGNVLQEITVPGDALVYKSDMPAMSREHLINEMLEQFLHLQNWRVQMVLEKVGITFGLSEVDVYYMEPVYQDMHWSAEANKEFPKIDLGFTQSVKFRALFGEDHLAVVNHTADLEYNCPDAYATLKSLNVSAALIYEMCGKVPGYVTFFKYGNMSRMWTESDKAYLNYIGKMIDLVIRGRN